MEAPLLNQKEVCELLGVSPTTLRRLRKTREIRYVEFGPHSIRFRQEDVRDFIRRRVRAVQRVEELPFEAAALTFKGLKVAV